MNDWQVTIQKPAFGFYVDLFIFRRSGEGTSDLLNLDSKGQHILVSVKHYETTDHLKPTLRLNERESGSILKALAEAIHNQGVSTDNDAKMRGLLEATKEHLSDMRKLVFK